MASEFVKLGRVAPYYRGVWDSAAKYEKLDVVIDVFGTAAYIARKDVDAGTPLHDAAAWGILIDLTGKKADAVAGQDSGNPVSIYPDEGSPLRVVSQMDPVQAGDGEPCMPGMGKNLLPPWEQGTISSTSGADVASNTIIRSGFVAVVPGDNYALSRSISGGSFAVRGYDADKNYIGAGGASITCVSGGTASNPIQANGKNAVIKPEDGVYFLRFIDYTNDLSGQFQMETGSESTEYVPYDNERPISASNPLTLTADGTTHSRTANASFYGGVMDWYTGELMSEWGFVELNGSEDGWLQDAGNFNIDVPGIAQTASELLCNRFVHAPDVSVNYLAANQMRQGDTLTAVAFGNPSNMSISDWRALLAAHPVRLVYRLETPVEYRLEPLDIRGAAGANVLSVNGKSLTVDYNKSLKKLFEEIASANEAVIQQQVQQWLDEHPEATTTIQDGAVTEPKLEPELLKRLSNPFLTPQMFGCACDGATDDAEGFQACINAAYSTGMPIMVTGNMYINSTITVPRGVSITGVIYNECRPKIFVGPDCKLLFDCDRRHAEDEPGVQNVFRDLWIQTPYDENWVPHYRDDLKIFDFHGDSSYNIDSELYNVAVCYAHTAVTVRARNVMIVGCLFSHCRYGVYYDFPDDAGNGASTAAGGTLRGLQVENVRFHGIGEEPEINFENSAAIYIRNNTSSNLTVRNCICDQGGTFIDGYATEVLIENNFVECFDKPALVIEAPDGIYHPNNMGSWTIVGNHFKGNNGGAAYSMPVTFPDHLVSIMNYGRILFSNNKLGHCGGDAIHLKNVIESAFIGNAFVRMGLYATDRYAFRLENVNVAISQNKSMENSGNGLCRGMSGYTSIVQSEGNFTFDSSVNITPTQNRRFYLLYSGKTGVETTLTTSAIPDGPFIVRRTDSRSIWQCMKGDTYITTPTMINANHSAVDYLNCTRNADTGLLTFSIDRLNTADNTWTTISTDFNIEVLI